MSVSDQTDPPTLSRREVLLAAGGLALAAAVSLGLSRFSYALLLPPMHADLGWSYFTGGLMNTLNAAGYLIGALLAPRALAAIDARRLLLGGGFAASVLLAGHGLVHGDLALFILRSLTGVASAASFVAGGVLAARLAGRSGGVGSGLVLGLYYGGTGLGIVASAWLVPPLTTLERSHAWQLAWLALAGMALLATITTARVTGSLHVPVRVAEARQAFSWLPLTASLSAYLMFGLGYIGYMTFIITLLREQGLGTGQIVAFYTLLGCGVVGSSWWWAGMLQRYRDGRSLALLNALLALATALPVLAGGNLVAAFVSGALFGAVFLSVVASTTALVRHNLAPALWPAGIAAFTIVFAAGQIIGPSMVGRIADGPGGLQRGLLVSAVVLALGAVLAALQKPLSGLAVANTTQRPS